MSELINKNDNCATIRWKLLTGVSALALTVSSISVAQAADSDHPLVWIEFSGELNQLNAPEAQFVPPFVLATPRPTPETISPLSVGHPARFGFGEDAKLTFQPENSDWVFSAAIRYGRSASHQNLRQQSPFPTKPEVPESSKSSYKYQRALQFMDTAAQHSETHTILDFSAGKDVGLGLFGGHGSSTVEMGVRFAQFRSKSNIAFKSDPDSKLDIKYVKYHYVPLGATYHSNAARGTASRSFHGIGPSISWANSTPIAGNLQDGEIAVDWGANAALLFGRQRAKVRHQATSLYHKGKYQPQPIYRTTLYRHRTDDPARSRNVTVPNIGGFAGLSYQYIDAKLSFGYRADFFFGAMDGGIDVRKSETMGFNGPYASISVGLGG